MKLETLIPIVEDALNRIAGRLNNDNETRAAERNAFEVALNHPEIVDLLSRDSALKQQADSAIANIHAEEARSQQADETLRVTSAAALAHLKKLQGQRINR